MRNQQLLLCLLSFAAGIVEKMAYSAPVDNAPLEYGGSTYSQSGKEMLSNVPSPDELEEPPKFPGPTTLENFPSPFTHARMCHHQSDEPSYVCDPDHILRLSDINRLEDRLKLLRETSFHPCGDLGNVPYMFVLAMIEKLPVGVDGDLFATELLEKWGVGHKECHDGVIMLYSKENNEVLLKWKRGVEPALNFRAYGALEQEFVTVLKRPPLAERLRHAVDMVTPHLSGEILPPRQTNQLIVVLAIASVIGLMYCACIINVMADQLPSAEDDPVKLRRNRSGE